MYPHPKHGSNVETDDTTHVPGGYLKCYYSITHIKKASRESRAGSQEDLKKAWILWWLGVGLEGGHLPARDCGS